MGEGECLTGKLICIYAYSVGIDNRVVKDWVWSEGGQWGKKQTKKGTSVIFQ